MSTNPTVEAARDRAIEAVRALEAARDDAACAVAHAFALGLRQEYPQAARVTIVRVDGRAVVTDVRDTDGADVDVWGSPAPEREWVEDLTELPWDSVQKISGVRYDPTVQAYLYGSRISYPNAAVLDLDALEPNA